MKTDEIQVPARPVAFDLMHGALLLSAFLSFATGASVMAQQGPVAAPVVAAPASGVSAPAITPPAPRASVLFERPDAAPGTIAAAEEASTEVRYGGDQVVVISTLALVLVIVIIVLLVAD